MSTKWTKEQDAFIIEHYPTCGPQFCSDKLCITPNWRITRRAGQLGLKVLRGYRKSSRSSLNLSFVQNLHDPEVAYLLGFLWADGCISDPKTSFTVRCCIQWTDYEALKSILDKVGWRVRSAIVKAKYRTANMSVGNAQWHRFLTDNDYHIKSRSSPQKILSTLPLDVLHYWWRGYFDGDGNFNLQPSHAGLCIAAPYDQDWDFAITLCQRLGITYSISREIRSCGNVSRFSIRNIRGVSRFCEYVYSGAQFGLLRKQKKYIEFKDRHKNRLEKRKRSYRGVTINHSAYEMVIGNGPRTIRERFPFTFEGELAAARRYDELATQRYGDRAILNFS